MTKHNRTPDKCNIKSQSDDEGRAERAVQTEEETLEETPPLTQIACNAQSLLPCFVFSVWNEFLSAQLRETTAEKARLQGQNGIIVSIYQRNTVQ